MLRALRSVALTSTICAAVLMLAATANAGTIIKMDLGGDSSADIRFDGTSLSTVNDGNAGTTGAQDSDLDFQDFLGSMPDVLTPTASFTLSGLTPTGPATVFGGSLVIQNFTGGTFSVFNPANQLLLSGSLTTSALTGPLGPPATGALFTTSISNVTGGQLAPFIRPNSLSISMSFTDINDGKGFSVGTGAAPVLQPFTADTTLNVAAEPAIPEPTAAILVWIAGTLLSMAFPGRRR